MARQKCRNLRLLLALVDDLRVDNFLFCLGVG
jgi:hypothetical protein